MNGSVLTFIVVFGIVIVVRGWSMVVRRREMRRRGLSYRGGWPGVVDMFREVGGGHQGHHGGGWSGGGGGHHGGGHHGGGGGGGDSGGGGHHG